MSKQVSVERLPQQIHQPSPAGTLKDRSVAGLALPASPVLVSVVVEAESPGDGHQPYLEGGAFLRPEGAQSAEVVLSKVLQNERVAIHHRVLIPTEVAGRAQQELGVRLDQARP